jgi:CheY-like chemotaxis protein
MMRRILIVDDNQLTRLLLRDALAEADYDVEAYADAHAALSALLAGDPPLACVVDQLMPGMTGAELVRSIRSSPEERVRNLPIVGISSRFGAELLAAGVDALVTKPFTDGVLTSAVEAARRARGR